MDERSSSSQPLSAQLYRLSVIAAERPEGCEPRRKLSPVAAGRLLASFGKLRFKTEYEQCHFFKADFMRFPKPSSAVFCTVFGCWRILKPTSTVPVLCHDSLPRLPQRFAAHLDLKGPSACMPPTLSNTKAEESFLACLRRCTSPAWREGVARKCCRGSQICHKPLPRKRRHSPHVFGGNKRFSLLLTASLSDNPGKPFWQSGVLGGRQAARWSRHGIVWTFRQGLWSTPRSRSMCHFLS
jgi:hypothetical protein